MRTSFVVMMMMMMMPTGKNHSRSSYATKTKTKTSFCSKQTSLLRCREDKKESIEYSLSSRRQRPRETLRFANQRSSSRRESSRFENGEISGKTTRTTTKTPQKKEHIKRWDRIRDRLSRDSSASARLRPGLPTGLSSAACGVWYVFKSSSCSCSRLCALWGDLTLELCIFRFFLSSSLGN